MELYRSGVGLRRPAGLGGVVLAVALLASACGSDRPRAVPETQQPRAAATGVQPGGRAPDFAITTTGGEAFRLSGQRGRTVVLDFLAPGCPSCAAEVPSLAKVWTAFRARGLVVLLIDIGGVSAEEVIDYYRGELGGGDHLYAVDEGFQVSQLYKVVALGTTVIVDRDGMVTYRDTGVTNASILEREVRKGLA